MELTEGFEAASIELKEFTKDQIAYYEGQGQSVDVKSHTDHCRTVYLLGKLKQLETRIEELQGAKNVTKETRKTGTSTKKPASRKAKRKPNRQLNLSV